MNAATPLELNALSTHLNDALLPFGDDWMFHVDAVRRPAAAYAPSTFPDAVTQMIDDERRDAYAVQASGQFETEYLLTVTHLPPADAYSRLASFFVQGVDRDRVDWTRLLGDFRLALGAIEDRLGRSVALERLTSDALLTHLHECVSGLPHPMI